MFYCRNTDNPRELYCTKPLNHTGNHAWVGHEDEPNCVWPNKQEPLRWSDLDREG